MTLEHIGYLIVLVGLLLIFVFRERIGDTWTILAAFGVGAAGAAAFVWRPSQKDRPARLEGAAVEHSLKTVERIDKKLDKIKEKKNAPHPENGPDPGVIDFLKRRDARGGELPE